MTARRILIAGIGNIFLGDDAFGVEVVQQLVSRPLPEEVRLIDFGIRGFDLACALLDGYDHAVLVDAVQRGGTPGTLYVIEPDLGEGSGSDARMDGHGMNLGEVFRLVQTMGGPLPTIRLVGCEPALVDPAAGLSDALRRAATDAVGLIESMVADLLTSDLEKVPENA